MNDVATVGVMVGTTIGIALIPPAPVVEIFLLEEEMDGRGLLFEGVMTILKLFKLNQALSVLSSVDREKTSDVSKPSRTAECNS